MVYHDNIKKLDDCSDVMVIEISFKIKNIVLLKPLKYNGYTQAMLAIQCTIHLFQFIESGKFD